MHDGERTFDLVRSPKLNPVGPRWYRYYAGFDPGFVSDICDTLRIGDNSNALDPWMGSGTTLGVAATRGAAVAGIDLNPAMVVVAKGRLLANDTLMSLEPLATDLISGYGEERIGFASEPLGHWLDEPSAMLVRGLAVRIRNTLTSENDWPIDVNAVSSIASFFFVALFEAVTHAVRSYASRNPTWIKRATAYDGAVEISKTQLSDAFVNAVKRLSVYLRSSTRIDIGTHDLARLSAADSREMPFATSTFDAVVTSPPYLTRLDYVMGHAPELAILGIDGDGLRSLRDAMIGTPTRAVSTLPKSNIGASAESLLERVRDHGTYAAKTYYEPNYRQYFEGMAHSFDEIQRVSTGGADVVLVVQDSRFKDIHIDLANTLTEMGKARAWTPGPRKDFANVRSMAQLNTNAHPVARSTKPIESVISFKLPAKDKQ